jgi:hypothetical protein
MGSRLGIDGVDFLEQYLAQRQLPDQRYFDQAVPPLNDSGAGNRLVPATITLIKMRSLLPRSTVLLLAPVVHLAAQTPTTRPSFGSLERLVGSWSAESGSGGQPGTTTRGGETWVIELGGNLLLRRDFSEYPAANGRSPVRHEGLMVIAPLKGEGTVAHAYDNEGHVIDYTVVATDTLIVFTSRPLKGAPAFRLTYRPMAAAYEVSFEIAPPDHPGEFQLYVRGILRR